MNVLTVVGGHTLAAPSDSIRYLPPPPRGTLPRSRSGDHVQYVKMHFARGVPLAKCIAPY